MVSILRNVVSSLGVVLGFAVELGVCDGVLEAPDVRSWQALVRVCGALSVIGMCLVVA